MRNYEYLMDKTVARETPVVYPLGTARAARACKGHLLWWQSVCIVWPSFPNQSCLTVGQDVVLTPLGSCAAVLKEKRWKIGSSRPNDAAPGGAAEAMDVS